MLTEKRVAAGGIVLRKTEEGFSVLLIEDGYGHWIWPKGHQDKGETVEQAALREVNEETGLKDLVILGEAGRQEYTYISGDTRIDKTVYIFIMRTGQKEYHAQTEEIKRCRWFSPVEALDIIEYRGSADILEKAIDYYRDKTGKNYTERCN